MEKGSMTVEGTIFLTVFFAIISWIIVSFLHISVEIRQKAPEFYQRVFEEKIRQVREIKQLKEIR